VLNLVKTDGRALQVILTRAARGAAPAQEDEPSPLKGEGISPNKEPTSTKLDAPHPGPSGVSSSPQEPSQPSPPDMRARGEDCAAPEARSPEAASPPSQSQTPRVLKVSSPSPPRPEQSPPSPPAQAQGVPKVLVPVASSPVRKAPLPPPSKKPDAAAAVATASDGGEEEEVAAAAAAAAATVAGPGTESDVPSPSDFKPLLMGMGAAFAQDSLPDDGEEDGESFGEPTADCLRDDLSEVSMDDSVLGDADDDGSGRRQCGLGITFRKQDGKGGVVVKRVKPGGGAEFNGDIFAGDRVMRIDGQRLDHLSQAELANLTIGDEGSEALLELVRASTGEEVMLSVTRARSTRGLSFAGQEVREYSLVSGQLSRESSREDLNEDGDLEYKDGRKIPRIMRTGLGLTFKPPDGKGGVLVKRVKEDGPAVGIVHEGDRIVSIDDWPLNDISNQALVRLTLGIPGTEASLKISRPNVGELPDVIIVRPQPPGESVPAAATAPAAAPGAHLSEGSSDSIGSEVSTSSSVARQLPAHDATCGKACGIGLTFRAKSEAQGIIVKRVKEGGAAALEGSIAAGDVVVSIDGTATAGLDQTAQGKLMMGAEGSVATLLVRRNGAEAAQVVKLTRSRPAAAAEAVSLAENSSDSLSSSTSSQASTSSSTCGRDPAAPSAKVSGIGLTFLKADKKTGGLPVKRVKDDGAAAGSGICPGDVVLSIDGVGLGALDTKALTQVMMGEAGSTARLEVLRKRDGQRETVLVCRGGGRALAENSSESVGSISSEASTSSSTLPAPPAPEGGDKPVGIGLTFLKPDEASGGLPVKRIKDDGAAVGSSISPGDIVVNINGVGPIGRLDSKALTSCLMGLPGTLVELDLVKKDTGAKQTVKLTRGAAALKEEGSSESIGLCSTPPPPAPATSHAPCAPVPDFACARWGLNTIVFLCRERGERCSERRQCLEHIIV